MYSKTVSMEKYVFFFLIIKEVLEVCFRIDYKIDLKFRIFLIKKGRISICFDIYFFDIYLLYSND